MKKVIGWSLMLTIIAVSWGSGFLEHGFKAGCLMVLICLGITLVAGGALLFLLWMVDALPTVEVEKGHIGEPLFKDPHINHVPGAHKEEVGYVCGGDVTCVSTTEEERKKYGCEQDKADSHCCVTAYQCDKCGTRFTVSLEPPEIDDF